MSGNIGSYCIVGGDMTDRFEKSTKVDFITSESITSTQKTFKENSVRKKCTLSQPTTESLNASLVEISSNDISLLSYLDCSVCQNVCEKCKRVCVTCKSPCQKCVPKMGCQNSYTDTDDFDKYLESQSRKVKVQPKLKTVSVDTCDLEGHFDYYGVDKKSIRIQKHVSTDCTDLNVRRLIAKKNNKSTVATDTSDLIICSDKSGAKNKENDQDEFFWPKKEETELETVEVKETNVETVLKSTNVNTVNKLNASLPLLEDDTSQVSTLCENVDKENIQRIISLRDVTFDTSSDDSDIDLITSCKLSNSKELAKKHNLILKQINLHEGIQFKCMLCKKIFQKKHLGTLHLGNHIENNKFKCLTCTKQFNSIDILFIHVQKNHSKDSENFDGTQVYEGDNKSGDDGEKMLNSKFYHCTLCTMESKPCVQFSSYKAVCLHKKVEHGITKSSSGKEKKVRIRQEFVCLICGKEFKSSKALKDHSPVHTGEKNYLCDICNKSYTTSANLKIHKRTHTGARNFVCSVCNKAFHKKDSLKVHFRKHSGERPFQCDLCPMRFDRNYILKNHRYTHFSEKAFICPFCGKTFTTHGGLNNHEKSHKKDPFAKKPRKPAVKPTLETENAVICDVCGKIYSTKSNLRIHKFVHLGIKPFQCNVCHQSYAKKDSMLTHMRKHYDDRPFSCETCGMKFYRNHTLKTHLLRHTGERPHKCKICGKSFTQSSSLAYHVKNHDRKIEKKKVATTNNCSKPKKKKVNGNEEKVGVSYAKKAKLLKESEDKRSEEETPDLTLLKNALPLNISDKDLEKDNNYLLPGPEKEIIILDKNLTSEISRNVVAKEIDFLEVEKDGGTDHFDTVGKFNYYIAKSHIFSLSKDSSKVKSEKIDESNGLPLLHSKSNYISKDQPLVAVNGDSSVKNGETKEIRPNPKSDTMVPIGEILNAAFISDENGEVIPFGPMTLHSLNADNIMISPVIALEGDDRKGFLRTPKLTVLDPKIAYGVPGSRVTGEKAQVKGNCHVINLKDARIPQKIHIEIDSSTLHMQAAVEDGVIQGIPGFYGSPQQNEL